MASMRARTRVSSESGAELVEFALVLPILLLLIAGIADFGLLFHSHEVTTNAAREGARLAVLPGYDANSYAAVQARVANYLSAGGLGGVHTTTVTAQAIDLGSGATANGVRVTVSYTHTFLFIGPIVGLINQTFASTLTYQTAAVMRTEIQATGL